MKTRLYLSLFIASVFLPKNTVAQEIIKGQALDSITITSARIELPFKENSRTITVITSKDIQESPATNLAELLQQEAGIDVRRQGVNGMQSDLYIRGGSFDQTLLLVDGIKVEDPQTGHHTLNMALPLEVIERIEIIKGPAARVFGQNAFTGAINIVTKSSTDRINSVGYKLGSYDQQQVSGTLGTQLGSATVIGHASVNTSEGYRYNTDFENQNYFVKGRFNTNANPIEMIGYFSERKFGANQFYAVGSAHDQYEETQSSLVGVSTKFQTEKLKITPRVYWKRNQDMYLYVRENPAVYRNLHLSNKVGMQVNASYTSNAGITGFGIDAAKVFMTSTNLGERDRTMANLFVEHRFSLADNSLDINPGISVNYFSDFKFHAFPGLDIGFKVSDNVKVYGNLGVTYRIPTYTDLYYNDRSTIGNPNLKPEEAFAQEIGLKYNSGKFTTTIAIFNRDASNLIDFIRPDITSKYVATNIAKVRTQGFELNTDYRFKLKEFNQTVSFGYNFLEDDILNQNKELSRYSLNTLKHQFTSRFSSQFFKNIRQNIVYKHAERTVGSSYNVWDASIIADFNSVSFTVTANNIFDTEYIEAGYVPMPSSSLLFGMRFRL